MRGLQRVGLAVAVGLVCALLMSLSAATASAQALRSVRLRVDPSVFEYVKQNGGFEEPGARSSTQAFGLFPSLLWIGVGVSPNNNINVGVNTMVGTSAAKAFGSESSDSAIMLVPYAEYVSNGQELRGFLSVHAGLGGLFAADAPAGVSGALGASFGVHYFMDEHVSFDPHLRLLYTAMPTTSETVKTFSVGMVFGVSLWLGSSKAAPISASRRHMRRSARLHSSVRGHRPPQDDTAQDNAAPNTATPALQPPTAAPVTPAAVEPVVAPSTPDPAVAPSTAPLAPGTAAGSPIKTTEPTDTAATAPSSEPTTAETPSAAPSTP